MVTRYNPLDGEYEAEPVLACITRADGQKEAAYIHFAYSKGDDGAPAVRQKLLTSSDGVALTLGVGDVVTPGACSVAAPECVESQEYTFAVDNTTTDWRWDADYEIEWSDGRVTPFSQVAVPASDNWSGQMADQWQPNIQAALNANQIGAEVTVRFRNNGNKADISGMPAQGSSPAIPGPSSVYISENLGAIAWRYINIQVCLGQPTPVELRLVKVTNTNGSTASTTPRRLIVAGPILGDLNKFWVCVECGKAPQWYLEDGVTLAELGQIPTCYEPCGTIAQSDSPAKTTCDFESESGCDDVNGDGTNVVSGITRIYEICPNAAPKLFGHFIAGPDNNLVDYPMDGRPLVDCVTLEPIAEPSPPCTDFVSLGNMWYLTLNGAPSTLVEWWADPAGTQSGTAVPHGNVSDIFTNDGTKLNHVSGPADNSYIAPTFSVEGSNAADFLAGMGGLATADTSGTDQGKLSAYFYSTKDGHLRDGGTRTGERGGLWLNKCCAGDLELVEERTTDTTSTERGVFDGTVIPAGIHYGEAVISDLSAWWNLTLEISYDNKVTYQPLLGYQQKPELVCIPVIKCKDTGALLNAFTMEILDAERLFCENICAPADGSTSSGATSPSAVDIADAIVAAERNVTPRSLSIQNNTNTVSLPVPPGTLGRIVSVEDTGTGLVYWTIDGTEPSATNGFVTTGPYHAAYDLRNVRLDLVRLNGSSTNSDYSIIYEIYN